MSATATPTASLFDRTATDYASYFTFAQPGVGRTIFACALTFCTAYGLAWLGSYLADIMLVATMLVTGSAFVAWAVWAFTLVASLVCAFYGGVAVGRWVLEREFTKDVATVRATATSLWGRAAAMFKKDEVEAEITAAEAGELAVPAEVVAAQPVIRTRRSPAPAAA